ncbi:MAG: DUF5050 domain-containing protein, partial [Clostridia bacterium]|nr:DUF5050 domain-containing protein [Clostridia bacterium]
DTNGENKQKISDNTTYQFTYADGWLYYLANSKNVTTGISETKGYYCTKADGSEEYYITDNYIDFLGGGYIEYDVNKNGVGISERIEYDYMDESRRYTQIGGFEIYRPVLHIDGWLYYREEASTEQDGYYWKLCRMKVLNGAVQTEVVIDGHFIDNVNYKDGKIYFSDSRKSLGALKSVASDLYCYDNGKITLLCDKNVQDFGFYGDKIVVEIGDDYDSTTPYIMDADGTNLQVADDLKAAYENEDEYTGEDADEESEPQIPAGGRREYGFTVKGDGWFTYLDYRNNVIRYDTETKTETEVYPCKGLHRYGKMRYLASKNDCMYKVDEDGNYTFLTDSCKPNYLFVATGAADGVQYLNFHNYF